MRSRTFSGRQTSAAPILQAAALGQVDGKIDAAVQGRKVYGLKVSKPQTLYIKRVETAAD